MKTKGIFKLISLTLALTLVFSFLSTTAIAVEAEETKIYFEVPTIEEWGTTKKCLLPYIQCIRRQSSIRNNVAK